MKNRQSVLSGLIALVLLPFGWSPATAQSTSPIPSPNVSISDTSNINEKPTGWYGSISPGAVFGYDLNVASEAFTVNVPPVFGVPVPPVQVAPVEITVDTDTGYAVSGAVGYQFEDARVELDVNYNQNSVNSVSINGAAAVPVDGNLSTLSLSANGYYDIPTNSKWRPYIGGGVGISNLSANDVQVNVPVIGQASLDDSGISPIFQVQAGVNYDFSERASAFVGYRLQGVPGTRFTAQNVDFEADTVFINTVQAGARVRF